MSILVFGLIGGGVIMLLWLVTLPWMMACKALALGRDADRTVARLEKYNAQLVEERDGLLERHAAEKAEHDRLREQIASMQLAYRAGEKSKEKP